MAEAERISGALLILKFWAPLLCTGLGFLWGARLFFQRGKALFFQLAVCALGCFWLGRLFSVVWLFTGNEIQTGFHVGYFGIFGGLLFLFSANFDQMDHLVDSGDVRFRVWRIAALSGPALIAAAAVWLALAPCGGEGRAAALLALAPALPGSYYACKHLLLPDEAMWLLEAVRPYQLCALGLCGAAALELAAACWGRTGLEVGAVTVQSALCLLIPGLLDRGFQKWME